MITGIGVDLVEVERIRRMLERHRAAFLNRILAEEEQALVEHDAVPTRVVEFVSGRFAAKEAIAKALGTGIGKISWHEIMIMRDELGAPSIVLYGKAKEVSDAKGIIHWHVSISHTKTNAIAYVIAESTT